MKNPVDLHNQRGYFFYLARLIKLKQESRIIAFLAENKKSR